MYKHKKYKTPLTHTPPTQEVLIQTTQFFLKKIKTVPQRHQNKINFMTMSDKAITIQSSTK